MGWAERRRLLIILVLGALVLALAALVGIATFYEAPSCQDNEQNQGEAGVDCGGPCPYLCRAAVEPPTVLYTEALTGKTGRTDVIASIENKNAAAAARGVPYQVVVYDREQVPIGTVSGSVDLPPDSVVPVFLPGVASGSNGVAARAFLTIDPVTPAWYSARSAAIAPTVSSVSIVGSTAAPRVRATLANPGTRTLESVRAVVLVRGKGGAIIAASSTLLPTIPGLGSAVATFTWSEPFSEVPLSVEVVPVPALL